MRLGLVMFLSSLLVSCQTLHTSGAQQVATQAQVETVILLVRHAERADDGPIEQAMVMDPNMAEDPPLSDIGLDRADLLARMLGDAGITRIYSTDYRRTRQTVQPTAEAMELEVALYDPSDLDGFADQLRSTPGRHLVVGHSNTTPDLVQALGGDPGPPIEPMEYDRLYVVTISRGTVSTLRIRFGGVFTASLLPPVI